MTDFDIEAYEAANIMAKRLTVYAFRNGPVEDMHADGKLSDKDMKVLNKNMVNRLAEFLYLSYTRRFKDIEALLAFSGHCHSGWDDANIDDIEQNIQLGKSFINIMQG